jgi:hypothetical protein
MNNNNDANFDDEVEIEDPEQEKERQPTRSASVLEKIKALLASTKPDKWQQWGEPLDESKKHQRPIEVWEQSYSIDTKAGVLALRSVAPITCNFFGGGYSYSHAGRPKYMVELRPRGWSPRMPAEVANRVNASGEKNYQVLADGEIARALFSEVEYNVRNFRDTLRVDFNDSVHRLVANCLEQVQATIASDWRVLEGEEGYLGYSGDVHGLTLTVALVQRGAMKHYSMYCTKHGYRWDCRDSNLIQDVFSHVDEIVRTASLEHLGKVLEEML